MPQCCPATSEWCQHQMSKLTVQQPNGESGFYNKVCGSFALPSGVHSSTREEKRWIHLAVLFDFHSLSQQQIKQENACFQYEPVSK